jgi:Holliday junction DNA helicase RuvA
VVARDGGTVEVETSGGVVYEAEVPLKVEEGLPPVGDPVELRTVHVVREDSAALYGFLAAHERDLFKRLLKAQKVGPTLALAMMSTYTAGRLAQALAEKDVVALTQVSGVGKKTAERLILDLAEKVGDLAVGGGGDVAPVPGAEGAVKALVSLGFSPTAANAAVRAALEKDSSLTTEDLIREALSDR